MMKVKLDVDGNIRYLEDQYFIDKLNALTEMEILMVEVTNENDAVKMHVAALLAPKLVTVLKILNARLLAYYGVKLADYHKVFGDIVQFEAPSLTELMGVRTAFSFCEVNRKDAEYGVAYDMALDRSSIDKALPEWALRSDEKIMLSYVSVGSEILPPTTTRDLTEGELHLVATAFVEDLWESTKLCNLPKDDLDEALDEINEIKRDIKNKYVTTAIDYPHGTYVVLVYQTEGNKYEDGTYRFDKSINEYFIQGQSCEYVSDKDWI